ncbi:hypothetical protein FBEOM_5771 [Fusarium beomiforme]|uniref:Uncharacterized protein n=1 Tax=Fusarium beomiforme TaxID=44412 RepID=A0A9P5AK73_9HYPO|nr:hypothetical protein FBEOM_5771 [Fusarium beomiforme]
MGLANLADLTGYRMTNWIADLSLIESLPLDILHDVLLAIDSVADFSSMIRASPTIYRHYLRSRVFWLRNCFELELGAVVFDAFAVYRSSTTEFRTKRTKDSVFRFIETYRLQRRQQNTPQSVLIDHDKIIPLVAFYTKIVKRLAKQFVAWTQAHHAGLSSPAQLSTTEARRILRAFYRYQLFCNLFSPAPQSRRGICTNEERLEWFLDIFEPWEIEEILCVNAFVGDKYKEVLGEVTWDFHPDNPKWDAGRTDPSTPEGAYNISWFEEFYRIGMSSLGLTVLSSIFKASDHSTLVDVVAKHIISSLDDWLFEATDERVQYRRRERSLSDRDLAQDRREEIMFEADREDLVPMAWVTIWKGTYSNLYGTHMRDSFRDWGYVMWDADRLVNSGAVDTLKYEWEDFCTRANGEIDDPRDFI